MSEIQRLVSSRAFMRTAKCFRSRPILKRRLAGPNRMRSVQRVIVPLGTAQQLERAKARHVLQITLTACPDLLEGGLFPTLHLKSIHGDEHRVLPLPPP